MELPQAPMSQRAIRCAAEKVYDGQSATVFKDVESEKFLISVVSRGTRQGDLLNSLLFYCVLQYVMQQDLKSGRQKGLGVKLGDHKKSFISTLGFADDVPVH